jgi:hypothetical protein
MKVTLPPGKTYRYTSATQNARKMYDQRPHKIMGRFYRAMKIDRSGGDGE